jgi:hypothetical protein
MGKSVSVVVLPGWWPPPSFWSPSKIRRRDKVVKVDLTEPSRPVLIDPTVDLQAVPSPLA